MKPTGIEVRTATATSVRAASGKEMTLEGTAAAYNTLSSDLGGFREMIQPAAFDLSLADSSQDVKMLAQHDPSQILGRRANGTLRVWSDQRGLQFTCKLNPENSQHKDLYSLVRAGTLSECSFAFTVNPGGDSWNDATQPPTRTLRSVKLLDCSVVTAPAYPSTQVDARGLSAAAVLAARGRKRGTPVSEEIKDQIRRHQCAVLGDLVAADIRQMTVQEISSYREYVTAKLAEHLASHGSLGGWRYIGHDNDFVYGVPDASFDPDWDDEEAMSHCARWNYQIDNGEVVLTAFTTRWANEVDPKTGQLLNTNAAPILAELREAAVLKRKMQIAAGRYRG